MKKNQKKVGLALGSGGIRGLAHVGVIKTLLKHNIPIDYIAGSSIGVWVSAHFAIFQDIEKLEEYTVKKRKEKVYSFLEPSFGGGLVKGEKISRLLKEWLNDTDFKDTKIPLRIVATDLYSGKPTFFYSGKIAPAVRASISVPTLFKPVQFENKLLVDGGISDPIPDETVRKMGADIVISVNLDNYIKNEQLNGEKILSMKQTAQRSLNILRFHLAKHSTASSDIIIEPFTPVVGISSFRDYFTDKLTHELVQNGIRETEKQIPKIKKLLSEK